MQKPAAWADDFLKVGHPCMSLYNAPRGARPVYV